MPLGAEHVQPAELADLVALRRALVAELLQQLDVAGLCGDAGLPVLLGHFLQRSREVVLLDQGVGGVALLQDLLVGQPLGVAAEHDVDAAPGHVGGHGDRAEPPGLGDDARLPGVLLGVEHLVGDAPLGELRGQVLALGHADRADQDRLPCLVPLGEVLDHRVELAQLATCR